MKIRNLALVLGAAFTVAAGGFAATACSSSNNNPPTGGGTHDSGTVQDSSTGNDSGNPGMDSGMMGDDGGIPGPDCGSTPSLHVEDAGTIFCGYQPGDAGAKIECTTGQQCCLGGSLGGGMYQPQECGTWGGTCPNNGSDASASGAAIPIECNQNADCTANGKTGNVCCLVGGTNKSIPGCSYTKFSGGTQIQCEMGTACAMGEQQVCSQDSDCPSGMHCMAGKWKIFQVGFCQ